MQGIVNHMDAEVRVGAFEWGIRVLRTIEDARETLTLGWAEPDELALTSPPYREAIEFDLTAGETRAAIYDRMGMAHSRLLGRETLVFRLPRWERLFAHPAASRRIAGAFRSELGNADIFPANRHTLENCVMLTYVCRETDCAGAGA